MVPQTQPAGDNGERGIDEGIDDGVGEANAEPVGRDVACAVLSFVVTVGALAFLYPVVVAAGRPFGSLASTAIVGVLVVTWLATWTCLETVWTRRVGRPNGA